MAAVIDVYSRQIVGWSMAEHMQTQLVIDAMELVTSRVLSSLAACSIQIMPRFSLSRESRTYTGQSRVEAQFLGLMDSLHHTLLGLKAAKALWSGYT